MILETVVDLLSIKIMKFNQYLSSFYAFTWWVSPPTYLIVRFLGLFLCLTLGTKIHAANELGYSWKISELARSPVEDIQLRDKQNRKIQIISAQQMVYLYAAMTGLAEVSEIQAEFLITDGEFPNAFAGMDKNGRGVVAINFAMLDVLGTDLNMAAGLIGHELAHLKLNHGQEHKEALLQNSQQSFSAKNTRYSRDNEREADYLGAIWAIEAGYDPGGAVAIQEALYDLAKYKTTSSFSVSHPSSIERITVLKSLVRRLKHK